jgi:DNA-binding IclR family transcriptional regulator
MVVNEREEGLISLSAPVRDHTQKVIAALTSSFSRISSGVARPVEVDGTDTRQNSEPAQCRTRT